MKTEIKDRWIEKLKSGDYEQAEGELFDGRDGYCCLGILCEVAVEDGIIEKNPEGGYYAQHVHSVSGESDKYLENSTLPRVVADWAGLTDEGSSNGLRSLNPAVPYDDDEYDDSDEPMDVELSELNDTYKLPFSEIAKLIKDYL